MRPSEALLIHREAIRQIVAANNAANPRVFGSTVRGEDKNGSDLDLLVDPIPGKTTLFSLGRIKREVETLTGVSTDILTSTSLHERFRNSVLAEAVQL